VGKPIIAAINGAAAGVGLVLAAFADLRFCVPGAKFTAAHGRFNFPAEYGLSWLLPRIVGLTHANDILISSRVFTAEEAMAMGFLNRIVPGRAADGRGHGLCPQYRRGRGAGLGAGDQAPDLPRPAPRRGHVGEGGPRRLLARCPASPTTRRA
jgi:enoyl-CoA hydratase/carnithine racemase